MHALLAAAALLPTAFAGIINQRALNYTFPAEVAYTTDLPNGQKEIKIRYGPFRIPGGKEPNAMTQFTGDTGLLYNQPVVNFRKPCDECLITYLEPGLEFLDGTPANTDKGLWLHHMVMFNEGPNRWDATCRDAPFSLPHTGIMSSAKKSERIFASGNERTIFKMVDETVKAGYYLKKADKMSMIVDLMNLNDAPQQTYLTFKFRTYNGDMAGWSAVKPVWLDADNCKMSDVMVPASKKQFVISSKPWKANFEGTVLGMGAHLHDGGTNAQITWNGDVACDSKARYAMGASPEKRKRDDMKEEHIDDMSYCIVKKPMKVGDVFQVNGIYDMVLHPGMENINNKLSEVMAISVFYVMVPLAQG